jgi:hypothetical protein
MSFVGRGLQGSGLGLFDPTASGIAVRSAPTCITPQEKTEAQGKCQTMSIHGLGQTATRSSPMSGRLAGLSACDVVNLPLCPTPKCIDEFTMEAIVDCMAGQSSVPGIDCSDPATQLYLYALSQLPYCSRPEALQQLPTCLSPELLSIENYCLAHPNWQGPDKLKNAACWAAMHDPTYWNGFRNLLVCAPKTPVLHTAPQRPPAPPPAAPPRVAPPKPPVLHTMAPPPPAAPPPPMAPPDLEEPPLPPVAPPASETRSSQMMGVWGILALLAVGGGGYYLYRRYK